MTVLRVSLFFSRLVFSIASSPNSHDHHKSSLLRWDSFHLWQDRLNEQTKWRITLILIGQNPTSNASCLWIFVQFSSGEIISLQRKTYAFLFEYFFLMMTLLVWLWYQLVTREQLPAIYPVEFWQHHIADDILDPYVTRPSSTKTYAVTHVNKYMLGLWPGI